MVFITAGFQYPTPFYWFRIKQCQPRNFGQIILMNSIKMPKSKGSDGPKEQWENGIGRETGERTG